MWELYQHCEPLIRSVAESCLPAVGLGADGLSLATQFGLVFVAGLVNLMSNEGNR